MSRISLFTTHPKQRLRNYKELGLELSRDSVVFNITSREQVIINTWYGGEMKKGMFSMMNYYLPLKGIASMHCSANTDMTQRTPKHLLHFPEQVKITLSESKRL